MYDSKVKPTCESSAKFLKSSFYCSTPNIQGFIFQMQERAWRNISSRVLGSNRLLRSGAIIQYSKNLGDDFSSIFCTLKSPFGHWHWKHYMEEAYGKSTVVTLHGSHLYIPCRKTLLALAFPRSVYVLGRNFLVLFYPNNYWDNLGT